MRRLILFGLAAAALGCGPRGDTATVGGVRDDEGRIVSLDAPARRVVSLSPATTDLLFAIGAGDVVVGRTQWGTYPPAALDVPSVGDGLDPNVEVVLGFRPDLVVFYSSPVNALAIERLGSLGIPSVSVAIDQLGSVPRAARLLGELTGTLPTAEPLAAALEAALDSASDSIGRDVDLSVTILTWDNPPIVIGGGSFLDELVRLAGARNTFGEIEEPSATVSIEAIAGRRPDVFLLIDIVDPPEFAQRPEWQVVDAVREQRFIRVADPAFSWPSVRAIEAIQVLRAEFESYRTRVDVGTPQTPRNR